MKLSFIDPCRYQGDILGSCLYNCRSHSRRDIKGRVEVVLSGSGLWIFTVVPAGFHKFQLQ